jgi:anti-sigma B factor antagonist
MSMNYAVRQTGDVTVLDLSGRISLGEAIAFGPSSGLVLQDLVREQVKDGHNKILLNLREVTYIDSSGLGELVSSLTTVRNNCGQLRICNASDRVEDLLRMTHLDSVLNFDKDEPTALQAFSGDAQKKTSAA